MTVNIGFHSIYAKSMTDDCTISVGENTQVGWSSHGKYNYANYGPLGNIFNRNVKNIIFENDLIDTPIMDNHFILNIQNHGFWGVQV